MNDDLYLEKVQEEEYRRINERPHSQHKYAKDEPGYGPEDCVDCGGEMITARREYGFSLCVPCKELIERRQ